VDLLKTIFVVLLILSCIFLLGYISIYLGIILPFILMPTLRIYANSQGQKELNNFIKNGLLTINNLGFHIAHEENILIPYENIKQILVHKDRADPLHMGRFTKYKTYKIVVKYSNQTITLFVDNEANLGYRKIYGNILETLKALKKADNRVYKNIYFIA
jgi:hypothetical protein